MLLACSWKEAYSEGSRGPIKVRWSPLKRSSSVHGNRHFKRAYGPGKKRQF